MEKLSLLPLENGKTSEDENTLNISGRYEEDYPASLCRKTNDVKLELRIDVDGKRAMNVVSGDIYSISGKTSNYQSSFIFERIKKLQKKNEVVLIGKSGKFDPENEVLNQFGVKILLNSHPLIADASWTNRLGIKSRCLCKHSSEYYRSVHLQNDYEEGVKPCRSYDINTLTSNFLDRPHSMTIIDAFAEAGIEIITNIAPKPIPRPRHIPRRGLVWTDNLLHSTMAEHFKIKEEEASWKIWLFSAYEYEVPEFKGILLTNKGKKRVGCVVFHRAIGEESDEEKRMQLFVYVHELGHCFSLKHPGEKTRGSNSSLDNGKASLSWMSNPQRYFSSVDSYGEVAFWEKFQFKFSDSELIHLRHAFRNDIIFAGNDFKKQKAIR